jgi:hypothetical protein
MSDLDDLGRAAGNLPPLPPSHPTGARFSVPASPAVPAQPPPTPRPLGTERVWFVRDGWGQQRGPLSEKELTNHLVAGRVGTDCVVWQHGWPAWQPILSYFQLPPPAPVYRVPVYARPPQRGMSGGTWALLIVGGLVVGCCLLGAANPTPPWKLVGALDLETKNPLTADETVASASPCPEILDNAPRAPIESPTRAASGPSRDPPPLAGCPRNV